MLLTNKGRRCESVRKQNLINKAKSIMLNQFTKKLVFKGLLPRTRWQHKQDGGLSVAKSIYYSKENLASVSKALKEEPARLAGESVGDNGSLRLDILYCPDNGKAFGQLYEYVPYEYTPCSDVYRWNVETIEKLIR